MAGVLSRHGNDKNKTKKRQKAIKHQLALHCIETIKLAIENLDAATNPETAAQNKEAALRYLYLLEKEYIK